MDGNCYKALGGADFANLNGTAYATLAAWQDATLEDQDSFVADPLTQRRPHAVRKFPMPPPGLAHPAHRPERQIPERESCGLRRVAGNQSLYRGGFVGDRAMNDFPLYTPPGTFWKRLKEWVDETQGVPQVKTPAGKYLRDDLTWATPGSGPGSVEWGDITGLIVNQTDLQAALDGKAPTAHAHAEADVTNLITDLAGKEPANANIQTHVTGTGSPHTPAGVGAEPAGAVATHAGAATGVHGAGASTLATAANIATHAALAATVHGFDASGNAPAQTHDNTRHSAAYALDSAAVKLAGQLGGSVASPDVRGVRETSGPTLLTLGAVADGQYLTRSGATLIGGSPGGGTPPAWKGKLAGAFGDGDPNLLLRAMLHNPVNATPTNISITVARCAYFMLDTALVLNKIRFFGVGATTTLYRMAIYRNSDSARITAEYEFSTTAQAWAALGSALGITLAANTLYFVACSADTVGTTAGIQCFSGSTGRIGVLPTAWPGNLDIDLASPIISPVAFAQFAVTAGALPATAPARVLQEAWTGGMPGFFLDNNNA